MPLRTIAPPLRLLAEAPVIVGVGAMFRTVWEPSPTPWTIAVVHAQPLEPGLAVFQEVWCRRPNPPAISMSFVAALANPANLLELSVVAVVPP